MRKLSRGGLADKLGHRAGCRRIRKSIRCHKSGFPAPWQFDVAVGIRTAREGGHSCERRPVARDWSAEMPLSSSTSGDSRGTCGAFYRGQVNTSERVRSCGGKITQGSAHCFLVENQFTGIVHQWWAATFLCSGLCSGNWIM